LDIIAQNDEIVELYEKEKLSINHLSKLFDVHWSCIKNVLINDGCNTRTDSEQKKIDIEKYPEMKEYTILGGKKASALIWKDRPEIGERIREFVRSPEHRESSRRKTLQLWDEPKYRELHTGRNHIAWKGGRYPYYGSNWLTTQKKALKKANYKSEISGENTGKLDVHHIYSRRDFINRLISLCYSEIIPEMKNESTFKIMPCDYFFGDVLKEINNLDFLIVLTESEHKKYENMPVGFFDAVRMGYDG
jgi:hypothetical protein